MTFLLLNLAGIVELTRASRANEALQPVAVTIRARGNHFEFGERRAQLGKPRRSAKDSRTK